MPIDIIRVKLPSTIPPSHKVGVAYIIEGDLVVVLAPTIAEAKCVRPSVVASTLRGIRDAAISITKLFHDESGV